MCGIAGILNFDGSKIASEDLKRMTDVIAHRGPDGEGFWTNEEKTIGLGHRRLSVIDISDLGNQPMHFANRYSITYNGEIYNYLELKKELIDKGYRFKSQTDTEVLMAGFDCFGISILNKIDGMFAFALWDNKEKTLTCARDRFGEKPFYYHYIPGKKFLFASEMKSIFAYGVHKRTNHEMLFHFLANDILENPSKKEDTFYLDIYKLEAGHYLTIKPDSKINKYRYWQLDYNIQDKSISIEESTLKFQELFKESITRRLRSDVSVGSSLSGGLDSSSVVAAINTCIKNPEKYQNTFSARFSDPTLDEGKYMQIIQNKFGIQSHYTHPDESTFFENYEKIFYHQEEPFGSGSVVAQWDVMKLAKKTGTTVLLDGQGADEILGGYHKYFQCYLRELYNIDKALYLRERNNIFQLHNKTIPFDCRFFLEAKKPDLLRSLGKAYHKIQSHKEYYFLTKDFVNEHKRVPLPFKNYNNLNTTLWYETTIYGLEKLLKIADRNAMAFSREVRLPFLSHKLVEFVFSLPPSFKINNGWTKFILRKSMEGLLPDSIVWRKDKIGFRAPQESWVDSEKMKAMITNAEDILIKNKIIKPNSNAPKLKILDAAMLFK